MATAAPEAKPRTRAKKAAPAAETKAPVQTSNLAGRVSQVIGASRRTDALATLTERIATPSGSSERQSTMASTGLSSGWRTEVARVSASGYWSMTGARRSFGWCLPSPKAFGG